MSGRMRQRVKSGEQTVARAYALLDAFEQLGRYISPSIRAWLNRRNR